jgi:MFS family permease
MMTAVAEQQLQRGVPTMVGAIGGLIIGGVEAALMTRRSRGHHLGWRRLIWLALATMVCLALAPSALVLAAPALPSPPPWARAQSAPASPINHEGEARMVPHAVESRMGEANGDGDNQLPHATPSTDQRAPAMQPT